MSNSRLQEGDGARSERSEDGRYRVFATLGRGGMAEVFLAVAHGPRGFNKLVVLKRLRPHLAEEASFREMFLDEARLAARLNHPNVVQSYEVGEGNGSFFIAMEYLDGQPLNRVTDELRSRGQRISPGIAARVIAEACNGLAHAHELRDYDGTHLQIIHRDVSPHNIFVGYDGQVKLVDFGIAKAVVSRAETEVGVLKGKVAYMAPEQASGVPIDGRADIFAMGIVLWELLTGRQLFQADNAAAVLHRLMSEPIPRPSSVFAEVDPQLEVIVMRALEKNPEQRFQTARELRAALEGWLRDAAQNVRGDDVGKLVTSLFEGVRGTVQAEIQKHMASVAAGRPAERSLSLSSIDQMERSGDKIRALVDLGPQATSASSAVSRKILTPPPPAPTGPRQRRRALLLLLLLAFAGVAGFFLWMHLRPPPAEPAPLPVALTAVTPAPAPEPPPTGAPPALSPPPAATDALPSPSALANAPASAAVTPAPAPAPPPSPASPPPTTHASSRGGSHSARPASPPPPAAAPPAPTAATQGFLTLDTYPWTRVSENGKVLGTTPIVHVALSPGAHVLTLDNPDLGLHQTYNAQIETGATLTRRLGLR